MRCRLLAFVIALLTALAIGQARADEPFDYFRNSWNVIGLQNYERGTRITPDNKLQLADGELTIRYGSQLAPLSHREVKTLLDGWLPVILLRAADGPVRYELTLFATPLPATPDWRAAFAGPAAGENYLNWIVVRAINGGQQPAHARLALEFTRPGVATDQDRPLAPGASTEFVARIPFAPGIEPKDYVEADAQLWLERTVGYWKDLMAGAAQIEVPCRKATEALRAAHVCQLIAADHGALHGGEGFYDEFYIRDGAYQIMELEEAGLWDATRAALAPYLSAQRPDGRFESQGGQLDANGQALWTLWQYWKISGDRRWLARVYPQMRSAARWIEQARRQIPADSPFAGLLPAAVADGEYLWDGKHHIVGYDLWNLRGLLCTAEAARALGNTADAEALEREADDYRTAIDAACRRTGLAHFPPSWEKAGTHWGNTETLWPTPLFPADDPRVVATIDHARRVHGGGFIEGTIQWLGGSPAIHPYMSAYTTLASLRRGECEPVVQDFYWYLLHSTAAHAFPEGIFPARRFAWSNTIPHVTGASNYAILLRHMLVDERADELHLLAAVPDAWLAPGEEIRIERAPTHFGPLSLVIRGTAAGVEVQYDPPQRQPPRRTVLYLPESRPLVGTLPGAEIVARAEQTERWDWPTVIERYRAVAGPGAKPIPGLAALPVALALAEGDCQMIDLSAAANTDQYTAPFGVEKPGKLLFTGLPPGVGTYGGVGFRILDPAANAGRGFVVLHSPAAPAERTWPREVEIAVGAAGKRLFFLGNVHGWDSHDPGTGPWGAVAEYVIHYADGQTQTVPLITGRTIDEWAAPPEADDVLAAVRGDPWHLNVLGVELRPVPVEKITFRDLGTRAAPVLVAVTLEKCR